MKISRVISLKFTLLLLLLLAPSPPAAAAVKVMSVLGGGSHNGTAANPYSLAEVENNIADGDIIIGLDGVYTNSISLNAQGWTLISSNTYGMQVIGNPSEHGLYALDNRHSNTVIGVKIVSSYISGIKMNGHGWTLRDCWITGAGRGNPSWVTNTSGLYTGQGVESHGWSGHVIERCLIETNGARLNLDHGIYISGTNNIVRGNVIRGNICWGMQSYDGSGESDNLHVYGNLIYGNGNIPGSPGGALTIWTQTAGKKNYVYNNTLIAGQYALIFNNGTGYATNNIMWSGTGVEVVVSQNGNTYNGGYNIRSSSTHSGAAPASTDIITSNFGFANTNSSQYWLTWASAARDTALRTSLIPAVDFFGRKQLAVRDIGAFQYDPRLEADTRNLGDSQRDYWVLYPHDWKVVPSPTHHEVRWEITRDNIKEVSYSISRKDSVNNTFAALATVPASAGFYMDPKSSMTNGVTYTYSASPDTSLGNGGGINGGNAAIVCDRTNIIHPTRLLSWDTNIVGAPINLSLGMTQFCNVKVSIPGTNILAVGDGIEDDQPAIQAALDRCPTNAYVYLPGSIYACYTNLVLKGNYRGMRGDGESTVLLQNFLSETYTTNAGITTNIVGEFINFGSYAEQGTQRTNIADINIGSTNATWDPINGLGASFPAVGQVVKFWINDGSVVENFAGDWNGDGSADPVHYSPDGSAKAAASVPLVRFEARITGTNAGNQVFFWPPSPWYFPSNYTRSQYLYQQETRGSCIENLMVDIGGRTSLGIDQIQTVDCWIKGVTSKTARKSHISIRYSVNPTVTRCVLDGAKTFGPSQGIGVHLDSHVYGFHIYDNVMRSNFPGVEVYLGGSGGAIQYNYFLNSQGGLAPIDIHNAHNFQVLVEGNVGYGFVQDGYFGGAEKWTLFRNWFHGNETAFGARKVINLGHWTRDFNIVNNVLGNPYTNWVTHILSNGWNNAYASIYRIGYPNMGNDTYGSTSTSAQATNYNSVDHYVWTNLLTHANVEYGSAGAKATNYNGGITNRTYPISYLTSWNSATAPNWWTNNGAGMTNAPWPAIGSDVSGHTNLIPAMIRFHQLTTYTPPPSSTNTYPPIDTNYVSYPIYLFWTPARIAPAATTPSLLRFSEKPPADVLNDGIPRQ